MNLKAYSEQSPTIEELKTIDGFIILEFGTDWCGHCQAALPAIEAVLPKYKIPHIKVLDGQGKKLGRIFKVKLWPTLILLKSGEEISRLVRPVHVHEVEEFFTEAVARLPNAKIQDRTE